MEKEKQIELTEEEKRCEEAGVNSPYELGQI